MSIRLLDLDDYEAAGGTYDDSGNAGERVSESDFSCALQVDGQEELDDLLRRAAVDRHGLWYDSACGLWLVETPNANAIIDTLRRVEAR